MYLVIVTVRLQAPLRENIFGCVLCKLFKMALKLALPNLKTKDSLRGYLHGVGMEIGAQPNERQFAEELDRRDDLACYGQYFHVPRIKELLEPEEVARGTESDSSKDILLFLYMAMALFRIDF